MRAYAIAFAAAAATSVPLVVLVRNFAQRRGLVDPAGGRKGHKVEVPRLGGLGIFLGFVVGVTAGWMLRAPELGWSIAATRIVLGAALLFASGLADDLLHRRGREGLPALVKLAVQIGAAALVASVARIHGFRLPGHEWYALPVAVQWTVTLIWIVGVTNAINFIDGMDGLAGGLSLIIAATLAVVAYSRAKPFNTQGEAILALALAGGIVGFLRCNFPPASIFMGDGGALLLGFVLSSIAISGVMKSATVLAIGAPLIILALPMVDLTKVVVGRVLRGQHPMQADRTHLHHRLQDAGWSVYSALLFAYAICGLCCSAALSLLRIHGGAAILSLAVALLLVAVAAKRPHGLAADEDE
jgi:UDP-GlcNAc:undecaprenyl-phosphate GlcNAc-1-phosphate transferase